MRICIGITFGGLFLFILMTIAYLIIKKIRLIWAKKVKVGVVKKEISKYDLTK